MSLIAPGRVLVIADFPNQENPCLGTRRWIIVLEDLDEKIIAIPCTTKTHQSIRYKKYIEVEKSSYYGREMQIDYDSLIICDRTAAIRKLGLRIIDYKGICPDELLDEIEAMLRP